jgi:hypothetical protein
VGRDPQGRGRRRRPCRDDAELIARSRIAGHRVADIARHHRLGSRTLWDRRHRAERTLITAHTP